MFCAHDTGVAEGGKGIGELVRLGLGDGVIVSVGLGRLSIWYVTSPGEEITPKSAARGSLW